MSFWKILLLIAFITVAIIIIMTVAVALVIASRQSKLEQKHQEEDDAEIH